MKWSAAAADLFLGRSCAGCDQPGPLLCPTCSDILTHPAPRLVRPHPTPQGFPVTAAGGPYAGRVRKVIHRYKESGAWALAAPLAQRLSRSMALVLHTALAEGRWDGGGEVVVIPAPSRWSAVHTRGLDVTRQMTVRACTLLSAQLGVQIVTRPWLTMRRGTTDQAGLDAQERAANLAQSMRWAATGPGGRGPRGTTAPEGQGSAVVLADDVVTTGATLTEMARLVRGAGLVTVGAATLAATIRHHRYPRGTDQA